jgi:putative glutamine amidotransferase
LIQDLEEAGNKDHRRHNDKDGEHEIKVVESTLLAEITGTTKGNVNSAHHQGISVVAEELMASAYSPDFVIEAIEWKDKTDKPWLVSVQWHPERMKDKETNVLSRNIREKFLEAVKHSINESN